MTNHNLLGPPETLTSRVSSMLDAQKDLFDALKAHMSTLPRQRWHRPEFSLAMVDDRRDLYWRIADEGLSLIYGESEAAAVDPAMFDDTFVDDVLLVWRPEGESFVLVITDGGAALGDRGQVLAVLLTSMERVVKDVES